MPINQLPPEILRRVLLYLQDTFPLIPDPLDGPLYSNSAAVLWHRTSLVCRHWRWVVLNTPELWTTIKIRESEEPHFDDGTNDWPWFKVALLRSRTLPLTVRFETRLDSTLSDRADVHSILDEVHRIRELRIVTSDDVSYRWLRSFLEQSPQKLEVLILDHGRDRIVSERQHVSWTCELPRLLVLHVASSLAWQFWSVGTLRHLSLGDQRWRIDDLLGLRAVLAANCLLEELLLDDIDILWSSEILGTLGGFPCLTLPKLTRLLVRAVDDDIARVSSVGEFLPQLLVHPPHCAQLYTFSYQAREHTIVKPHTAPSITRLFIGTYTIAGTDGASAFAVHMGDRTNIYDSIEFDAVRELWVTTCSGVSYLPVDPTVEALERPQWQAVTKLVITREPTFWLGHLGSRASNLPSLEELHIYDQRNEHGTAILGFLMKRQRAGLAVRELRFVRDLFLPHEAFYTWKKGSWKFAKFVDRVVFEDLYPGKDDATGIVSPARTMELPEVCNTPSPVSSLWKPWNQIVVI